MTQVRLVCNPLSGESRIYIGGRELTEPENRLCEFLRREDFYVLLRPFRRRYVIWQGLLPEILEEVNDPDTGITFVGRETDFAKVQDAFDESRAAAENIGYGSSWSLFFEEDFEESDLRASIIEAAADLVDLCETKIERREAQLLMKSLDGMGVKDACGKLLSLLEYHLKKWRSSSSPFASSKIGQLMILKKNVSGIRTALSCDPEAAQSQRMGTHQGSERRSG